MSGRIKESALLKALAELEEGVEKGDELQDADTEGGFSTEGEPLSKEAMKDGGEDADVAKADDSSDDESSDDGDEDDKASKGLGCDHVFKGQMACRACAGRVAKADDDSDEDDKDDDDTSKSFRQRADQDDTLSKGIEVSDFLESIVNGMSETVEDLKKSVDQRIGTFATERRDFDRRLAKAIVRIGNAVETLGSALGEQDKALRRVMNMPHVPQRKSVISKSEIVEREFESGLQDPIRNIPPSSLVNWLTQKAMSREINEMLVFEFEASGYNPDVLPPDVKKSLVSDLCK